MVEEKCPTPLNARILALKGVDGCSYLLKKPAGRMREHPACFGWRMKGTRKRLPCKFPGRETMDLLKRIAQPISFLVSTN